MAVTSGAMTPSRHYRRLRLATAVCTVALIGSACGSSNSSTTSTTAAASSSSHGTAAVACAGSLDKLYSTVIGPAFKAATGDTAAGPPCAGSLALSQEILSKEISPGAFMAVGAKAIKELFPARAKFALAVATDPLVVGYSSKSRYFSQLNAIRLGKKPLSSLFSLFATSGFRLGRTDPSQDPQGEFFILMTDLAQTQLHLPAGQAASDLGISASHPYGNPSQLLSEDALPTDIATGTVDAGSEYLPEALQYGLDYIKLPASLNFSDPADLSTYATVRINVYGVGVQTGELINLDLALVNPPAGTAPFSTADENADQEFLAYLLSSAGRAVLAKAGYTLVPPVLSLAPGVTTAAAALPTSVLTEYTALHGSITTS
jgi:molybdate/tungstate transport system substrate-binding protein